MSDGPESVRDMTGAKFNDVNDEGLGFDSANLTGTSFTDVNLSGAQIGNANLSGPANINANIADMTLDGIPLSEMVAAYDRQKNNG